MNRLLGNPKQMWSQSGFAYKFFVISSFFMFFIQMVWPSLFENTFDLYRFTILELQLWRLVTALYSMFPKIWNVLSVIFSMLWIFNFFNQSQRSKSTVYQFWEVFLISLELHIFVNIVSFFLNFAFPSIIGMSISYGWFPVILIYEFRRAIIDPEGSSSFCFMPCLIKNKYFPYFLILIFFVFERQPLTILCAAILGFVQEQKLRFMIIKLPFCWFKTFENILPNTIVKRSDFVSIVTVEDELRRLSCGSSARAQRRQGNNNPFFGRSNNEPGSMGQDNDNKKQKESKKSFGGSGVVIDDHKNKEVDYKMYWMNKQKQNISNGAKQLEVEFDLGEQKKKEKNQQQNDFDKGDNSQVNFILGHEDKNKDDQNEDYLI